MRDHASSFYNDQDGTCDLIDPDDDNDGISDFDDAFPFDPNEWVDRNSDGLGDNAHPLTTMDHMRLNPEITIIGIGLLAALLSGTVAFVFVRRGSMEEFDEDEGWDDGNEDEFYDEW